MRHNIFGTATKVACSGKHCPIKVLRKKERLVKGAKNLSYDVPFLSLLMEKERVSIPLYLCGNLRTPDA